MSRTVVGSAILLALAAALALPAAAQRAADPRFPPAQDPGGVAVAILATGFDYTQPDLARSVARDGEGEPIAWDFAGNDPRPYLPSPNETPPEHGGDGTLLARTVIERAKGRVRLVPVRVDPGRPVTLAQAVAFAARTPARIVLVPLWGGRPEDWEPFRIAAAHFRHLLFVVSSGETDRAPVFPAALALENMLVVTAIDRDGHHLANADRSIVDAAVVVEDEGAAASSPSPLGRAAAEAAVIAAEALQGLRAPVSGAELKRRILGAAQSRRLGADAGPPLPILVAPPGPGSASPRRE
jgi:hypothetical protein